MVGMSAAFLTTLSLVPQIIIQDKKNEGCFEISYDSSCHSSILWIIYGALRKDPAIVGANATASTFSLILLYYSFAYAVSTYTHLCW